MDGIAEHARPLTHSPPALALEQGVTTAPDLLTERDLITLMDKHGIGTGANAPLTANDAATDALCRRHHCAAHQDHSGARVRREERQRLCANGAGSHTR